MTNDEMDLFLSHQRDLQIGWPILRLVKSTTVNVFTPIKKHVVVDINTILNTSHDCFERFFIPLTCLFY